MASDTTTKHATFFRDKVVLLTGATGNLGSSTLFKLITELNAQRVYAIVRGSQELAVEKLQRKFGQNANISMASSEIRFVVGDIRRTGLGLTQSDLRLLEDEVDIIIHSAADISLLDTIDNCMKNNCDPVLELALMAGKFKKLEKFVFVSSVYANSFLPDGLVEEKLYPLTDDFGEDIDPELEREDIARTGSSAFTKRFAWPYALSKYLAERLLLTRFPTLPVLIVRASTIGPAFRSPFPLYGDDDSYPIQNAAKILLKDPQANNVWHAPVNATSGTNILDEIPVDWTSNVMLLHIIKDSSGIVHASAGNYIRQTANDALMRAVRGMPGKLDTPVEIKWIDADSGPQCALANLFVIGNRDWNFDCARSATLRETTGLLSLRVTPEDFHSFNDRRFFALLDETQVKSPME